MLLFYMFTRLSNIYISGKKFDDIGVLIKVDGDSIARSEIKLNEVTVYPPLQFKAMMIKFGITTLSEKPKSLSICCVGF